MSDRSYRLGRCDAAVKLGGEMAGCVPDGTPEDVALQATLLLAATIIADFENSFETLAIAVAALKDYTTEMQRRSDGEVLQ